MIAADWWASGKPDLAEMRQFMCVMLSGAAVAAIGFCGRWLVDSDANGVPDEDEPGASLQRAQSGAETSAESVDRAADANREAQESADNIRQGTTDIAESVE